MEIKTVVSVVALRYCHVLCGHREKIERKMKSNIDERLFIFFFFNNFLLYCRFNNCLISFGKKKKIIPQFLKLFCKLYPSRRIVKLIIKYEMYHFVILNIFVLTM